MLSSLMGFAGSGILFGVLLAIMLILPGLTYGVDAPNATVLTPWSKGMAFPARLAMDTAGNSYVGDARGRTVLKFDPNGNLRLTIRTSTPVAGVAVTSDGKIVVSQGDSVVIYGRTGKEVGWLGKGAGQFQMANGIAVDGVGYIYVVDSLAHSVQIFTPSGRYSGSFGSYGTATGQFSSPTGIAYEKISNQLAVADSLNRRVQFFDTFGGHRKTLGGSTSSPVQFTSPQGIAFEYTGGSTPVLKRMYVVDTFQNLVQVIDPSGNGMLLSYLGEYGTAGGKLIHPSDAVFDQAGSRLVVANGKGNLAIYGIDVGTSPIDTTPPKFSITRISARTDVSVQTIGGKVEAGAAISIKVDTGALPGPVTYGSPTSWQCTITGLAPGDNVLTVTARDASGNSATQTAITTYRLPAPVLTINPMPAMTSAVNNVFTGIVDDGGIVAVSNAATGKNGAAAVSGTTWSYPVSLAQGANTINVTAKRPSGASASATMDITLDNIPPTLTVSALADKSNTGNQVQNITGMVSDSNLQGVAINGEAVPVVNNTFSSAVSLNPGTNLVILEAEDLAGNSIAETRVINFDTSKPVITITGPADNLCTNKNVVTFSGSVDKEATVTVGGIPALMDDTRWNATVFLSEGFNTIEVIAVDHGGNSSSLKRTIILDFAVPEVCVSGPGQDLATNKPLLVFTGAVGGASKVSVSYSINGAESVPVRAAKGKYGFQINFPAEGVYRVAVTAVDAAGNSSRSVRTVVYDTTVPELTVAAGNTPASSTLNGTVEPGAMVTVTDKNGIAGTVAMNNAAWIAELLPGYDPATLAVTATDAAGNVNQITYLSQR